MSLFMWTNEAVRKNSPFSPVEVVELLSHVFVRVYEHENSPSGCTFREIRHRSELDAIQHAWLLLAVLPTTDAKKRTPKALYNVAQGKQDSR
jgi:hypothetical protein